MKNHTKFQIIFQIGIIGLLLLTACGPLAQSPEGNNITPSKGNSDTQTPDFTPTATLSPTATSTPTLTPTPKPSLIYVDPSLPAEFRASIQPDNKAFQLTNDQNAPAKLTYGAENPISQWIYTLVAPFPTVTDEIKSSELLDFWKNSANATFNRLILDQSTYQALASLWGNPKGNVEVLVTENLLLGAWTNTGTWAIIPFEEIQPRWKVIAIDGQSPIHKDFSAKNYPLNIPISLITENNDSLESLTQTLKPYLAQTNREADKLATVILTGVTAMVRGTAKQMEEEGITRPADVIGPTLREADILHISNEVPFAEDCGDPVPKFSGKLSFCSKDSYLELLKVIGTDIVELTGDHYDDKGPAAMLHTLSLYKNLSWAYYGGGSNIEDAKKPVKLEVNGNKIAFLGCNAKERYYSNATETKPGNFRCDWDYMIAEIKELKAEGYLPIVTFQHNEYYQWSAHSELVEDFHRMEAAGAVIVSGSQAHVPHEIEITDNAVLHYGLGNLFFDQYGVMQNTNKAFIDRHVFYDGKYLGVELLTIQFKDYSQPIWMDPTGRAALLEKLFWVSEWNFPTQ